jgi:hypothetical protein
MVTTRTGTHADAAPRSANSEEEELDPVTPTAQGLFPDVANEAFLGLTTISRCQHVEDPDVNNPILAAVILPLLVWRSALSSL